MSKYIKEVRAQRFSQLLEEKGVSIETVSKETGIEYGTLIKLKEGIIGSLQGRTAAKIAEYFTVDTPINTDWIKGLNVPKYRQATLLDQKPEPVYDSTISALAHVVLKVPQGTYKNVYLTGEELQGLYTAFGTALVDKAINCKSRLITEGKDRYKGWASDFSALYHYLNTKEKEERYEDNN